MAQTTAPAPKIISADIIRSIPMFYWHNGCEWIVAGNLDTYQKEHGQFEIDPDKLEEFIASGYVYGNGTVYKNVFALQAGETITFDGDRIRSERHFEFRPVNRAKHYPTLDAFVAAFDKVLMDVFSRMVAEVRPEGNWILPLSGGIDSRIIAYYLHRLGEKKVVCFSYGTPASPQSLKSKQVAEVLGYPWHFVEYTEEKWLDLHQKGLIDDYIRFAFNGVSTPHLQDFLAVYELKKGGVISPGDMFVPGHTFNFIAGSDFNVCDLQCNCRESAVANTFQRHSRIKEYSASPVRSIEKIFDQAFVHPVYFQEYFDWQEQHAKYIANSIRTYEFFGFDAKLPYWDKEIVDFWLSVPDEDRLGRKILIESVRNGLLPESLKHIPP